MSAKKNTNKASNKSNKSAPKPPALRASKPKDESEEIEVNDEDEDDDEDEKETGSDAKSAKIRYMTRVHKTSKRINVLVAQAVSAPRLHTAAAAVMTALKALLDEAGKLGDDWKPAKGARPGKSFGSGDIVQITEDRRGLYDGLIEKSDMDELRVIKQIGKKVSVKCASGDKMFLPAGHLAKAS